MNGCFDGHLQALSLDLRCSGRLLQPVLASMTIRTPLLPVDSQIPRAGASRVLLTEGFEAEQKLSGQCEGDESYILMIIRRLLSYVGYTHLLYCQKGSI